MTAIATNSTKQQFTEALRRYGYRESASRHEIEVVGSHDKRMLSPGTVEFALPQGKWSTLTLNWYSYAILNPLYFNPEDGEVTYMIVAPTFAPLYEPQLTSLTWVTEPLARFRHNTKCFPENENHAQKPSPINRLQQKLAELIR